MTDQLSGGLELRPARPEEFDACRATLERWYGLPVYDEDREVELATFEPERSLGVFDGGEPVATAGIYGLDLTVPGGPLPVAGVTWISVLPTYRRRGLLTAMLSRQLRELHEGAGEPVAALFASEPGIYGRFGYGLAAFGYAVTVPGGANGFVAWAPAADGRLRLAGPGEALAELRSAYDGVWRDRVGYYARTAGRWQARLHDPEYDRHGAAPLACVLHESDGGVDGYALYSTKGDWDREVPSGIVSVREVLAATPSCAAALWRFLLDHDLMGEVSVPQLAVDDPLLYLLDDPRRVRTQRLDNLWVRLVDVDRALAGRRYAGPVDLVLEVTDVVCRWNEGRFQLSGDTGGATCARTVAAPDLLVDARDLGAAYLGGTSLGALAAAGRVEQRRDGALRAAARAFAGERAPFCPLVF